MNKSHARKTHAWVYVGVILVAIVGALTLFNGFLSWIIPSASPYGPTIIPRIVFQFFETIQVFNLLITSLNAIILTYLLYTYVSVYQEIRSQFTLGLIALATALLAHTVSANPIVAFVFGFHVNGLGPFALIPTIFTLIASVVLVHLSQQ